MTVTPIFLTNTADITVIHTFKNDKKKNAGKKQETSTDDKVALKIQRANCVQNDSVVNQTHRKWFPT